MAQEEKAPLCETILNRPSRQWPAHSVVLMLHPFRAAYFSGMRESVGKVMNEFHSDLHDRPKHN